jgi:hypothetical protein
LVEVDDTFQLVGMQDLVTRRVGQVGLMLGGVIWTILGEFDCFCSQFPPVAVAEL